MRKLLLLFVCALVSIGAWAGPHDITQQDGKYYIGDVADNNYYTVENGVLTFHVAKLKPTPPDNPDAPREAEDLINKAWNNISINLGGATRIAFANDCFITQADIEKLFTNGSNFYFDFYEITNGTNTPMKIDDYTTPADDGDANNIDQLIAKAATTMASQGKQAKGIILPLNTGIGTSAVEKAANVWGQTMSTFTEYVCYYRSSQEVANIYVWDQNTYYSQGAAATGAQTNFNTAASHLLGHSGVSDSDVFIVGSNNVNKLNLSALPSGKTEIEIVGDDWIKYTDSLADIYVFSAEGGHIHQAVTGTGINGTPCNKLVVTGPVTTNDVKAVNDFGGGDLESIEGPHVYDLKDAEGAVLSDFSEITNDKVEYIVLPYDMADESIPDSTFSEDMTSLKAAIATSSDKKTLSAYVKVAGSLAMARYYATGGSVTNGVTNPTKVDLTTVVLSGSLNAADITQQINNGAPTPYIDANGHWSSTYAPTPAFGLNQESSITSFDLKNAVFPNQYDMNFYKAGYEKLTSVILPTSEDMDRIPEDCFNNIKTLTYLCVPYNFKYIESGAFLVGGAGITRLTTTDANGAEIDNGPNTWTLSANIKELGSKPSTDKAFVKTVFPYDVPVTDVYCLAVDVPKCYANVFPSSASYGYGGPDNTMPYCRDRYYTNGNKTMAWLVLRFPSLETFNNAPADKRESSYDLMKQLYTDVDKKYTKMEQTGAVDANGDPILWPTRQQSNRVYNQASYGLTWYDWTEEGGSGEDGSVPGGVSMNQSVPVGSLYTYTDESPAAGTGEGHYANVDITDYLGWHQITLSQATYFEPDEEVNEQEEIVRNYENAGLYTFCIPYDMTIDEVCELMGVPASDDSKKIVNMFDRQKVTEPIMPEIYQLQSVTRYTGTSASDNNVVNFVLSENLYSNGATKYLEIDHDTEVISTPNAADAQHPNRCLVGGRPYIIKAYKRFTETISKDNLGKYVMTRNADKFDESASCINSGLYEQLGSGTLKTLQFAIPYEQHKVQAVRRGSDAQPLTYDEGNKKYYYTMVGQYWEQDLPLYCIYMAQGAWWRYGTDRGYKWAPYKCVIMPTQEESTGFNDHGGGFRDQGRSQIPNITGDDLLDKEFQLGFLDGRDDDDFKTNGAKYVFTFDDGITVYDADGNMTSAIKQLDGEDLTIGTGNGKVYNISGQHVGNSLNGLSKGMYIVNGKKVVVK